MELKNYQKTVMRDLSSYLDAIDETGNIEKAWISYWSQKDIVV